MEGYFTKAELATVQAPPSLIPRCGICGLSKTCRTPKMQPSGSGRKKILVVGEAPGASEDMRGSQFVGMSGVHLRRAMKKLGVDLYRDCVLTNALICRPPGNTIETPKSIDYCRPNLLKAIEEYDPEVIILLGTTAVKSLITHLWKEDPGGIKRWSGFRIPCRKPNAWICPVLHPSYVMRDKRDQCVYQLFFERQLAGAIELAGTRPWEEIPDYEKDIDLVFDCDEAAKIIRKMIRRGGDVAFDFETNSIKPDAEDAEIVCCSVSWMGKKTISYPWRGDAIVATRELLRSDLGKIASNAKFEERWTMAKLGMWVKNWKWDTMIQAHVLDSRSKITGLKFQAFALLGQPDYDGHLKSYLESKEKGGNAKNRVRDVDLRSLLTYNALDALLEYKVAMIQMKQLGVK